MSTVEQPLPPGKPSSIVTFSTELAWSLEPSGFQSRLPPYKYALMSAIEPSSVIVDVPSPDTTVTWLPERWHAVSLSPPSAREKVTCTGEPPASTSSKLM